MLNNITRETVRGKEDIRQTIGIWRQSHGIRSTNIRENKRLKIIRHTKGANKEKSTEIWKKWTHK